MATPLSQRCSRVNCESNSSLTNVAFVLILLFHSVTSFHEGIGGREEPRRIAVQRREQGREDRGGGQCEDQEDRRREREFFHCHSNPVNADRSVSNDPP